MPYHQNSAGHGGRRCETARKTEVKIHGHHQEGHQKECADGRQHSRPQELEIGSVQGDPLTWKSLQGEKVRMFCGIECINDIYKQHKLYRPCWDAAILVAMVVKMTP